MRCFSSESIYCNSPTNTLHAFVGWYASRRNVCLTLNFSLYYHSLVNELYIEENMVDT